MKWKKLSVLHFIYQNKQIHNYKNIFIQTLLNYYTKKKSIIHSMATAQQISNITTALHTSFPNSGFLVTNSTCQLQSSGQTLIDYKGLKVIKFEKSQVNQGDYDAVKFNNICHARCQGENPGHQLGELYAELRSEFPFVQLAVVSGEMYQATGEFTLYKKGSLSVYIY